VALSLRGHIESNGTHHPLVPVHHPFFTTHSTCTFKSWCPGTSLFKQKNKVTIMKILHVNQPKTSLKISLCLCMLLLAGFSLVSYKTGKLEEEIWNQLGLSKQDGNTGISNSFLQGYFYYYGARKAKNIAAGNRGAIVKELGNYAKQYVSTDAFKKEYLLLRESRKPESPKAPKTLEMIRGELVAGYQKSIKEMEPMLKSPNPDLQKVAKEGLAFMQKQLKDAEDPNNELLKIMAESEKTSYEYKTQEFKTKMETWEKEFPESQMVLVKSRLQQFLTITEDVDFNAELKEKGGKKYFVKPAYEGKSTEWKQAFRAGKDATEAARSFAKEWLKELN
jgi:hypothetical protein